MRCGRGLDAFGIFDDLNQQCLCSARRLEVFQWDRTRCSASGRLSLACPAEWVGGRFLSRRWREELEVGCRGHLVAVRQPREKLGKTEPLPYRLLKWAIATGNIRPKMVFESSQRDSKTNRIFFCTRPEARDISWILIFLRCTTSWNPDYSVHISSFRKLDATIESGSE